MAYIEKKTHTAGNGKVTVRWRAQVRDAAGKKFSRQFKLKVDAETWAKTAEADLVRGDFIDPAAGRRLFRDVAKEWQEAQVHRDTTIALVGSDLRNHILTVFGDRQIATIRPSEVQAWVKRTSANLAPATVKRVYRRLAAIFRMAVNDGLIKRSPCVDIKLPTNPEGKVVPLRVEEVEALLEAMPERYRALVVVGAGSGLRQGEAFGLTVPNIDFLRDQAIHVAQQLQLLPGRPTFLAAPKTPSSVRTVPVGNVVLHALARHLEQFPAATMLPADPAGQLEPLVFTDDDDGPIRRNWFSANVWVPARKAAGLPANVTYHDLRHFYASLLIHRGASVKVVQARLGHKSALETLNTYSHLWPDDDALSRTAVDDVLGGLGQAAAEAAEAAR